MDEEAKLHLAASNMSETASVDSEETADRLEVMFDSQDHSRRKSSLSVPSAKRPAMLRSTSCFVHSFLQGDKLGHAEFHQREPAATVTATTTLPNQHLPTDNKSTDGNHHGGGHSRLLTKKQLSDMAYSIRELSKRLGRVKLKINVKSVFLLTKAHDPTLIALTRQVAEWLLSGDAGGPYTVWVENTLEHNSEFDTQSLHDATVKSGAALKFWTNELCAKRPHTFDIILSLGGDGTVLYASWLFQRVVPPVLAFALGSLGFLTKFDFNSHKETLSNVFQHGLTVSLRLRLEATVMRAKHETTGHHDLIEELIGEEAEDHHTHKPEQFHDILNDLVLDRGPNPTMSSIEVFGDNYHITTVQADGVCVATPTGSTAYNLAAGGSLCHPDNPVVLVTAICAHTLSFRPIILPDTIVLRLGVSYDARASSWVSFDGRERVELHPGDYVTISASRFPFPTVLPLGEGSEDWIDSLSRTLNWNSRQRQKAFKETSLDK